jgi:integrase
MRPPKPWFWSDRDGWYVTIGGKRHRLAEGREGKAEAEREFHRLMLTAGRVETDPSRLRVRDLCNLFLGAMHGRVERGERAPVTLDGYDRFLTSACAALGDIRAPEIRPKDVLRWADSHPWNPTSRHDTMMVVKVAFRWGHRAGYLAEDPLVSLELPRPLRRVAIPTPEEAATLIDAAQGPFRDFLVALRETGCRPIEVTTLSDDRVNLGNGTWLVRDKIRGKTGEPYRPIYLTPTTIELSDRLIRAHGVGLVFRNGRGAEWSRQAYALAFAKLRRRLDLGPGCSAYGFRHLYVTDALQRGVDPATVAQLVGHRGLATIMKYYNHLDQRTDHLRRAVRAIRPGETSGPDAPPAGPAPPR